jgi:hypothetical protein
MLRVAAFACLLVFLFGCGDSDPDDPSETSYGPLEDVKAYRQNIEPIIVEVSAIEALVQERAVGSANVATAENLYPIYLEQRPKLLQIMEHIDRIKPPSALADLHQDIRRLVTLPRSLRRRDRRLGSARRNAVRSSRGETATGQRADRIPE